MTTSATPSFADDLQPMTREDYDGVVARYVERCAAVPGVRAIYQFGAVSAPGLSDLDLIVVLDTALVRDPEELQVLSTAHPHWRSDPMAARCFIHDVLLCDIEVFRSIAWLIVGSTPRLVAGMAVDVIEPEASAQSYVALVQALDFCLGRLHEFARLRHRPGLSKRWLIPQLWSISHTRSLLRAIGIPLATSWNALIGALEGMRSNAFAMADDALGMLWSTVEVHFSVAATLLLEELTRRGDLPTAGGVRRCVVASPDLHTITVYASPQEEASASRISAAMVARSIRVGRRRVESGWTRVTAPGALLHHHLAYLRASPAHAAIAERIARHAGAGRDEGRSSVYREVIRRRIALVETNTEVLRRLRATFGRVAIPGLPCRPLVSSRKSTLRYRALKAMLDRRILPVGTVVMGPGLA
jgi:hypothetical protein